MSLDGYPIGNDQTQLQRVADVMYQFNLLPSPFKVKDMILPSRTSTSPRSQPPGRTP